MFLSNEMIVNTIVVILIVCPFLVLLFLVLWFRARARLKRYAPVIDAEAEARTIVKRAETEARKQRLQADELSRRCSELRDQELTINGNIKQLRYQLLPLEELNDFAEQGLRDYHFAFDDHASYVRALDICRKEQKAMVKEKIAVECPVDWSLGDSRRDGKTMVNRAMRLTLRAFNHECDTLVSKVTVRNADSASDRVVRSARALEELNASLQLQFNDRYVASKIKEVRLAAEEKIRREEEKERLREQRAAEREEARALREIEQALKKQAKEEAERRGAIEALRRQLKIASTEHRAALEAEIESTEKELAELIVGKGRLLSMAEQTRIGHLYVISNRGSLGERIVKIGMTRRLEPMDRVKELGDASVPFPFDVHAMVFSEDAPSLERKLHQRFDSHRLNKVNLRREFFEVPLEDVHAALAEEIPDVPFEYNVEATEFTISKANRTTGPQSNGQVAAQ